VQFTEGGSRKATIRLLCVQPFNHPVPHQRRRRDSFVGCQLPELFEPAGRNSKRVHLSGFSGRTGSAIARSRGRIVAVLLRVLCLCGDHVAAVLLGHLAFARFFRVLGEAALDLARELEHADSGRLARLSLDEANLGSLQRRVAEVLEMRADAGVSPRQIAQQLDRGDEPNIRTALTAMQKRGVAEMVPSVSPQRWRLTSSYRRS
jgi:hypothetical protein